MGVVILWILSCGSCHSINLSLTETGDYVKEDEVIAEVETDKVHVCCVMIPVVSTYWDICDVM